MISSVIPSLKYSFSGSALMFVNGRTAMDCSVGWVATGGGIGVVMDVSARANSAADEKRCAGSGLNARLMASRMFGGTVIVLVQ